MLKSPSVLLQYFTPQLLVTRLIGLLCRSKKPWLKNWAIQTFVRRYQVDMTSAQVENPLDYPDFNSFFTRQLKPEARPIAQGTGVIASPVDGFVSQIGKIEQDTMLQAKGRYFTVQNLLGGTQYAKEASEFQDGCFATLYLSPRDYHRVHMPVSGKLRKTIFVPGEFFSVNPKTTAVVGDLFARNERLVCLFDTALGPMAIVMVGAMLVGSIHTVWHAETRVRRLQEEAFGGSIELARGAEMGYFELGSTAIVLFGKDKIEWDTQLKENTRIVMGQAIGKDIHDNKGQH